jgi:hypothetical protein
MLFPKRALVDLLQVTLTSPSPSLCVRHACGVQFDADMLLAQSLMMEEEEAATAAAKSKSAMPKSALPPNVAHEVGGFGGGEEDDDGGGDGEEYEEGDHEYADLSSLSYGMYTQQQQSSAAGGGGYATDGSSDGELERLTASLGLQGERLSQWLGRSFMASATCPECLF